MKLGVVFPQTEIGSDPGAIRAYAQAAEALGYHHLIAFDQVVGLNPASRPDWQGVYTYRDLFHEPLVLFGYLAAVTEHLELVTGVLVLPQRQTALVAKQAAEVDVLSRGRLRLGIGVGLKADEYEALDATYHDRGTRSEEQIELLRALWGQELITYTGQWHTVSDGGLNPLPIQRPIPIWFGGHADAVVQRLARLGDGWIPLFAPDDAGRAEIEKMRRYAREAGRDPVSIGVESWITIASKTPDSWREEAQAWKALGATHLSVNTMRAGLGSPEAHIEAIGRFMEAISEI
jgi:probable F420-dependent oxidoreductase